MRYSIGNGKYIYNKQYEPIILATERFMLNKFLIEGVNIVIDEVGISKKMRKHHIEEAKRFGYKVIAEVMPYLDMKTAVDRRMSNPHGQFDRNIWEKVWSDFEVLYEEPTKEEGLDEIRR